jgi:hypothetical protein
MLRSRFVVLQERSEFRPHGDHTNRRIFPGYQAAHYHVRLKEEQLSDERRPYARARIEIQVASVLMQAWAEVEHDLVYKPNSGDLSEDEHAILDELNGLVLAGEIALQRLQRAVKRRVAQEDRPFSHHHDLAAYLYPRLCSLYPQEQDAPLMGRADALFLFLQRERKGTPGTHGPVLSRLDLGNTRKTLAELIVQRIVEDASSADDKERPLDEYETMRRSLEPKSSLAQLEESVRSRGPHSALW